MQEMKLATLQANIQEDTTHKHKNMVYITTLEYNTP